MLLAAVAVTVAIGLAGCDQSPAATPAPTATPTPTATLTAGTTPPSATEASPDPSATPTATATATATEPDREAELAQLRASNRFLELAEADRARHATWARFAYDLFAPHADGEPLFEWANKDELWDSIAPSIRDECLLAGPPASRPMWDTQVVIPAAIDPAWSDGSTGHRGQFVAFSCNYSTTDAASEELVWGALITSDEARLGLVLSTSDALRVKEADYPDFDSSREAIDDFLWEWIVSQPPRGG